MSTKTQETSHNTKIRKKRLNNVVTPSKIYKNFQYVADYAGKCHLFDPPVRIHWELLYQGPVQAVINGSDLLPFPHRSL